MVGLLRALLPNPRLAHEAYVLTQGQFQNGLKASTHAPLSPLFAPGNLRIFGVVTFAVAVSYLLMVVLATTGWADRSDRAIKRLAPVGPLIIRLALAGSFFFAAASNSFLGPEINLPNVTGGGFIRLLLFALALMILAGFLTEFAAMVGIILMLYLVHYFGDYLITYANYLGELLVLMLFGSRLLSLDGWLFGAPPRWPKLERYNWLEVPIVRILYGIALIYAGYSVKFAHPTLTISVYNEYHLINFFHLPAAMIAAGAGLAEILIGFFVLIGFALRWTLIVSLTFITLSLLYFHEMLWPHLMLYGISLSLLINAGDPLTVDHYLIPWAKRVRSKVLGF